MNVRAATETHHQCYGMKPCRRCAVRTSVEIPGVWRAECIMLARFLACSTNAGGSPALHSCIVNRLYSNVTEDLSFQMFHETYPILDTNIRDVGAGNERQNQEGWRSKPSDLPSLLDASANHQLPAPFEVMPSFSGRNSGAPPNLLRAATGMDMEVKRRIHPSPKEDSKTKNRRAQRMMKA